MQWRVEETGYAASAMHYLPTTGDDIGLFFHVLFPLLPLRRAEKVWSKREATWVHVKSMDPVVFHRLHSVRWAKALGAHRPLWKWRRVAFDFFRNACPSGRPNAFEWPGFYMSLAEIDLAVTEATYQFAMARLQV